MREIGEAQKKYYENTISELRTSLADTDIEIIALRQFTVRGSRMKRF